MKKLSNFYKALSDPTRLKILKLLENGELCVCDIVYALNIVQPKVSFHMRILKNAKIIKDRKSGKWNHYEIDYSDLFARFIIMSTLQNITDKDIELEKERLQEFIKNKCKCKV